MRASRLRYIALSDVEIAYVRAVRNAYCNNDCRLAERMANLNPAVGKMRRMMFQEARNLGFVDVYQDRATAGCPSVVEMRAQHGDRFLRLQFWGNGKHTVSHGLVGKYGDSESLVRDGLPTDFQTLAEMYRAIAFEWQRKEPQP